VRRAEAALLAAVRSWRRRQRGRRRARWAARRFGVPRRARDAATRAHLAEVDAYWRAHFGRSVDPTWHLALARLCGTPDVRWIPSHEWQEDILPFLNDLDMRRAYRDKSLAAPLLAPDGPPPARLERIRGRYYADGETLSRDVAAERLVDGPSFLVVKPSRADDGTGVRAFAVAGRALHGEGRPWQLEDLEAAYGANFIVQERIRQHPRMAAVHPSSVNTLRLVTLRWDGALRLLLAFARFGVGGRVTDNAGTGGLCCGIDEHGRLDATAVDARGRFHGKHPDTGHDFGERLAVPGWPAFPAAALRLHARVRHFDLVSWDFAVGEAAEPVLLEMNFKGVAEVYQLATRRPLFGDLTAEILEAVRDDRGRRRAPRPQRLPAA
jgi:hypothetical protein